MGQIQSLRSCTLAVAVRELNSHLAPLGAASEAASSTAKATSCNPLLLIPHGSELFLPDMSQPDARCEQGPVASMPNLWKEE